MQRAWNADCDFDYIITPGIITPDGCYVNIWGDDTNGLYLYTQGEYKVVIRFMTAKGKTDVKTNQYHAPGLLSAYLSILNTLMEGRLLA